MWYVNANKIARRARLSTLNIGASFILLLNSFAAASPLFLTGKAFAAPSLPSVPVQTLPTNGASLTDGNVTLAWDASTGGSGTVFYTVAVATSSATNADGSFSSSTGGTTTTSLSYTPSSTLAAGTYYWNVEACNDNSGSHCSAWSTPESFTIAAADTTGPTIVTTTPTDNEVIPKNGSYTVSAVVSDPSGVQSVSYSASTPGICFPVPFSFCIISPESFSGTLTDPDHDGTYTATLDTTTYGQTSSFLFSIPYTFTFTATDNAAAHNSTTKTASGVTFSTSVITPVSTASVTGQDFDTWDNSANGFKGINVGFETADFTHVNSITVTLQKNGSDIVSNTASAALLDDINTQQGGFTQNGSLSTPFVVSGTLNDTYCQGGPCWDAGTHTWQTTEQPDTAVVTVTGTDASGSITKTATLTNFTEPNGVTFADLFPADTTPPTVPTGGLPNNSYETTNDFYFTWNASSDALSNPVSYEFQSSLNPASSGGVLTTGLWNSGTLTSPTIHSSGAPDGTWYWQVRAKDAAGNYSGWSDIWNVTIDTTKPADPSLVSPHNGVVMNGTSITQTWSDSSSGIDHYVYESYNDAGATSLRFHTTYTGTSKTATNVAETTYWWRVKAVDKAGNESGWSPLWKITVDNTAPVATITAPGDGDHVHGTVPISGTVTDANPDHYYLVVRNSHGTIVAGPGTVYAATVNDYSWDTTKVADGVYTIDLEARDQAGNKDAGSTQTITVTVDNTAPLVTVDTLSTTDTTPVVTGTVDDADADVTAAVNGHNYSAAVSTTANGNGTYNWMANVTDALAVGSYDVTATATDATGNIGHDGTTNELTITAPPVTLTRFAVVTTPPQTGQGNSNGSGQDQNQGQVLGDNAGTPTPEDQGHVKGDQTSGPTGSPQKAAVAESGNFLGLGWWWLLIVAIVGGLWFAFFRRRNQEA